jgi:small nuclear ribonucleoprotein (snRNP)-like protein
MLFYSYFKTLVGKEVRARRGAVGAPRGSEQAPVPRALLHRDARARGRRPPTQVTVELKNDLAITGVLHSVDQYLNIKLTSTRVVDEAKYPHMVGGGKRTGFPWGAFARAQPLAAAAAAAAGQAANPSPACADEGAASESVLPPPPLPRCRYATASSAAQSCDTST